MERITTIVLFFLISICLSAFNYSAVKYLSEGEKLSKTMATVLTGLTVISLYTGLNFSDRPIAEIIFATLLIITGGVDYKTKTIVTATLYLGGFLAVGISLLYGKNLIDLVAGGAMGFALYLLIYTVAKAYYKREAFGYGDVIFMGAIGGYLGFWHGLLASVLTFYVALIFILLFALLNRVLSRKAEVAFAPFMAISAWIVSIYGDALIELYLKLFLS